MRTRKLVLLSLITAQAIVIHYIEGFIPLIAPGAKLGLANIMTLVTLFVFNVKYAFVVSIIRIILGSLLGGNIMGIIYGLVGGMLSLTIMSLLKRHSNIFSLIGISTAGAAFHNIGQLMTASIIYSTKGILFTYLPVLMLASAVTGYFTGLASDFIINHFNKFIKA